MNKNWVYRHELAGNDIEALLNTLDEQGYKVAHLYRNNGAYHVIATLKAGEPSLQGSVSIAEVKSLLNVTPSDEP